MFPYTFLLQPFRTYKLDNSYWFLYKFSDIDINKTFRKPFLYLQNGGRFSVSFGCNNIIGTWSYSGNSIQFNPGPATLMACPQEGTEIERLGITALKGINNYAIVDNRLFLNIDDKTMMIFQRFF